jgi:hypothetical protein
MAFDQLIMAPVKIKLSDDDHDQQKGIHFFNLYEMEYQTGASVEDFYNEYRNLFVATLRKKGDTIVWQNNRVLEEDEQLSRSFEEIILINVLDLIDIRMPGHVRDHYQHLPGNMKWLMDYKSDIFAKMPTFLQEMEGNVFSVPKNDIVKFERYASKLLFVLARHSTYFKLVLRVPELVLF